MNKYIYRSHDVISHRIVLFPVQIVVLWNCDKPLPPRNKWPSTSVPLTVTEGQTKVRAAAFFFFFCTSSRAERPPFNRAVRDYFSWFLLLEFTRTWTGFCESRNTVYGIPNNIIAVTIINIKLHYIALVL